MAQGDQLRTLHTPDVAMEKYVNGSTGNDSNNGDSGSPWLTLQGAQNYIRNTLTWPTSGDLRINVAAGTYQASSANERTLSLDYNNANRAPATDRWLIWQADGAVKVVPPDGASGAKEGIRTLNAATYRCQYIQFRDFEVDGLDTARGSGDVIGVDVEGTDVQLIGLHIHHLKGAAGTKAQGVYGWSSSTRLCLEKMHIHHIGRTDGIAGQEHGAYLTGADAQVNTFKFHHMLNGFGLQYYSGSGGNGSITANGTIYDVTKSCIVVSGNATSAKIKNMLLVGADEYGILFLPNASGAGSGSVIDRVIYSNNTSGNRDEASPSGWTITNELTDDPEFTDAVNGDFTISATSPAIGYSDSTFSSATDWAGTTRPAGAEDAGAYEYTAPAAPTSSNTAAVTTVLRRRRRRA